MAAGAQLVDVLDHDHARLHRDAEERQEADAGRHAEVGAGQESAAMPPIGAMATVARISRAHFIEPNIE